MRKSASRGNARRFFLALFALNSAWAGSTPAAGKDKAACLLTGPVAILASPMSIRPGGAARILAASDEAFDKAVLRIRGPSGFVDAVTSKSGGGPPFWRILEFKAGPEGTYTVSLTAENREPAVLSFSVSSGRPEERPSRAVWENRLEWGRACENLYSAWLEALFRNDEDNASWKSLDAITGDPRRNVLHNHLGLGEDDAGGKNYVRMRPDCADNPFFLRAYFAWKLGLPFGFHECSRGNRRSPPRCSSWTSNLADGGGRSGAPAFRSFLGRVMNVIHSGTARPRLDDEACDYYPVSLTRRSLRPGVVFADPYGHTLVIARWVPQARERPGGMLAVDAQPDGTVGLKRFWRGNFLFSTSDVIGDPGFKAFRPIVRRNGRWEPLGNDRIAGSADYGNFSLEQKNMPPDVFYDTMECLINPEPLDPEMALRDLFRALHEQLLVRVESVANGEDYMKAHPGAVIPMPSGAAIFQTLGPWEDFATPNRDMRLLIAIDTVLGFPEKLARKPEVFKLPRRKKMDEIRLEIARLHDTWARALSITYIRSNGAPQTLTIEDILRRRESLEMGYNPNDCAEIRWGAPAGSGELATCRRKAPPAQTEKMKALRGWFRKRLHPVE